MLVLGMIGTNSPRAAEPTQRLREGDNQVTKGVLIDLEPRQRVGAPRSRGPVRARRLLLLESGIKMFSASTPSVCVAPRPSFCQSATAQCLLAKVLSHQDNSATLASKRSGLASSRGRGS